MRQMFGRYPEYHTSADDKSLISFDTIRESVQGYFDTIMALELDFRPYGRVQRGGHAVESPIPLYRNIRDFRSRPKNVQTRIMLKSSISQTATSLLDMAESKDLDFRLRRPHRRPRRGRIHLRAIGSIRFVVGEFARRSAEPRIPGQRGGNPNRRPLRTCPSGLTLANVSKSGNLSNGSAKTIPLALRDYAYRRRQARLCGRYTV